MEKTKENEIPNLVNLDGSTLIDIENQKRAEILSTIKEKRQNRDSLLKKSSSFKTKINDFLGRGEGESLRSQAKQIETDLYRDTARQHEFVSRDLAKEANQVLQTTVKEPLGAISTLYRQKENKKKSEEYKELDFKIEEQKIIESFKPENIVAALSNMDLRKDIVFDLKNFFNSQHNWQIYQNIERVNGYSNKEAKGFPVDVAKAVLEGIHQAIEQEGVLNIEDSPSLFLLLNEVVDVYPDGLTHIVTENIAHLMVARGSDLEMHKLAQLPRLMNIVESSEYGAEFSSRIDEKLTDLFNKKKWSQIDYACKSFGEALSEKALSQLDTYLQRYGLRLEDVQRPWGLYPAIGESGFRNLETNMEKIEAVETERPGSVKVLFADFNIREFRRYPTEVLIEQYDQRKMDMPYGVVVYTNQDHNQAFDTDADVIKSLFEQSKGHNIALRVLEFDSKYELMKNIAKLDARYGTQNKISYVVLGAHGQEESFQTTYTEKVTKNEFEGNGIKRMKNFFIDQPEIVLASCSTGAPNGIGQKISETYGATVHAPGVPTNVDSITMTFEVDKPIFSVKYRDDVLQTYAKGERQVN